MLPIDSINMQSPIKHTIKLAGSFGELRSNHFHSGIDIKSTNGQVGDSIYVADDGFVSRIRITYSSYGKALYVDHPSGYTTVYAHLLRFNDTLETYIQEVQKYLKSYDVDIYLDQGKFEFKKGEFLAIMGSTGRSYGPHLHFEIRETEKEIPVNPFLFGIKPSDKRKAVIHGIQAYAMTPDFQVQDRAKSTKNNTTLSLGGWRAGVAIKANDFMDGSYNKTGLYKIQMTVDDTLYYSATMDAVSFDETKYINACIDYETKQIKRETYFQCFKLPGNSINLIDSIRHDGLFKIFQSKKRKVDIVVSDFDGNMTKRTVYVQRKKQVKPLLSSSNFQVPYHQYSEYNDSIISLSFSPSSVYKPENIAIEFNPSTMELIVGDKSQALHQPIDVKIRLPIFTTDPDKDKYFLGYTSGNKIDNLGGQVQDSIFHGRIFKFGKHKILKDITPPSIVLKSTNESIKGKRLITIGLNDNYGTYGDGNSLKYQCSIDGQWVIGEYSSFKKSILIRIPKEFGKGKHLLQIECSDDRQNYSIFTKEIQL